MPANRSRFVSSFARSVCRTNIGAAGRRLAPRLAPALEKRRITATPADRSQCVSSFESKTAVFDSRSPKKPHGHILVAVAVATVVGVVVVLCGNGEGGGGG